MRLQSTKYNIIVRNLFKRIYKYRYLIILSISSTILVLIFGGFFKMLFFLLLLTAANIALSTITRGLPFVNTSLELIMLNTILSGLAYGSIVGSCFGLISAILYYLASGRFSYYVSIFAPMYFLIGLIVPAFAGYNVFYLGMTIKVMYTIISSTIVILLYSARIEKAIAFAVVNTGWNLIIFKYIAPILLTLMK